MSGSLDLRQVFVEGKYERQAVAATMTTFGELPFVSELSWLFSLDRCFHWMAIVAYLFQTHLNWYGLIISMTSIYLYRTF